MNNTLAQPASSDSLSLCAATLEKKAAIFKALGHPIRLRIVQTLMNGERCVCDLHEHSQRDMSTISSHLKVLKSSQIIKCRQVGKQVFYSLNICCLSTLFSCIDRFIENSEEA